MGKPEHQEPIEPAVNIIEEVNETNIDCDNVGSENMGNNPEVMKTNNSVNLEKCANEM